MRTAIRVLALAGAGLASGAVIGVGPAQAATFTEQGPSASQAWQPDDNNNVIAYFDTQRNCERAGEVGKQVNLWQNYDCNYIRWGNHHGEWALEIDHGWDWNGPGGNGNGPGDNGGGDYGGTGHHGGHHH